MNIEIIRSGEQGSLLTSKFVKLGHIAGFISIQNIGRERHCTLKKDGFEELQAWIFYFDEFWISKLKKLETLLNNKLSN
ncbi:MAG TPA: hypothetical protein VF939_20015 [Puia sp.]